MSPLLVIVGPTASGKSGAALALARRIGGEIVSADSQQVYRGLDVGTAKPSAADQRAVSHHAIDVVDPDSPFDAARWVAIADDAIASIRARGRRPIVAGGTGLYVRALLFGLVDAPPADPDLRAQLLADETRHGSGHLFERLRDLDPSLAARLHENDLVRIVRALEVRLSTGVPLSTLQTKHAFASPRHEATLLGIAVPAPTLRDRIVQRTRAMIENGWADEVRSLLARYPPGLRSLQSLGYRQMVAHVRGELSIDDAQTQIVRETVRFARRQRTWFAKERGIAWFEDPDALVEAGATA